MFTEAESVYIPAGGFLADSAWIKSDILNLEDLLLVNCHCKGRSVNN